MYDIIKILHSYWAYLVLLILILATFSAIFKFVLNKGYFAKDFRISLFALIVSHIQLFLGLLLYFISPNGFKNLVANGIKDMPSLARLLAVDHPFVGILAIVLITIGYSKHKKKLTSRLKFKTIAIFYALALILVLSRIPWSSWPN